MFREEGKRTNTLLAYLIGIILFYPNPELSLQAWREGEETMAGHYHGMASKA